MLSEEKLIQQFATPFDLQQVAIKGIGDDAAVIPKDTESCYVISKDLLIEEVHFRLRYYSPKALAHKAIHSNLSDIAAMGAKAKYLLLGLALPPSLTTDWINTFQQHFCDLCLAENILLIGGDTNRSPNSLMISITVIGEAPIANIKYRSNAKSDDIVCMVGNIGEAFAGFTCLESNIAAFESLKNKSFFPNALQKEGQWLGERKEVSAMMDISDGLFIDSQRLCESSQVGAQICLKQAFSTAALKAFCVKENLALSDVMLRGGEDYALLFTVASGSLSALQLAFAQEFKTPFFEIGKITTEKEVQFYFQGEPIELSLKPFRHF